MRKNNFVGFAEVYLKRCNIESDSNEIIDIEVYKKLFALDSKLGTTPIEQLYKCIHQTTRSDIIKVGIHYLNENYEIILGYRFWENKPI